MGVGLKLYFSYFLFRSPLFSGSSGIRLQLLGARQQPSAKQYATKWREEQQKEEIDIAHDLRSEMIYR